MKKNKKSSDKQNFVIGLVSILLISIITIIYFAGYFIEPSIKIDNNKDTWKYYDDTMSNIKIIMDDITTDSELYFWWDMDVKIKDKDFNNAIALLVSDVRVTYIMLSESDEYYNSGVLLKYRGREEITKDELELLNKNYNVDDVMLINSYEGVLISKDEEKQEKFMRVINDFHELKKLPLFTKEDATYEELVLRHILISEALENVVMYLQDIYLEYK